MSYKVLILDDDADFNSLLTDVFEQADYDVTSLEDPVEALDIFTEGKFDLVVTDHKMPEMTGTEYMKRIKTISPKTPVIMVSGYLENDAIRDLIGDGVGGVFLKPLNIFSLLERTAELIAESLKAGESTGRNSEQAAASESESAAETLAFKFRSYPCRSEVSLRFAERLYGLRNFKSTLTLTGEKGMHFHQICKDIEGFYERNYEHFIYLDSKSLDRSSVLKLIHHAAEANHERVTCVVEGADALSDSQKIVVTEMAKLENAFEALPVHLRVIFCLSQDIDDLFDKEHIDENLYILMGTAEVSVPPLRECAEDIPILAQKLAVDSFRELGKDSVPRFDSAARDYLQKQPWPGNFEALRLFVHKAMERTSGNTITLSTLLSDGSAVLQSEAAQFRGELALYQNQLIRAAWNLLNNDAGLVAELFGSDIATVERKLNNR